MIQSTEVAFPDVAGTVARIHELTRAEHGVAVDARAQTSALLGDDQFTNVFLVGAAVQAGALPVPARYLEQALELNGVAVEKNLAAFRAGRRYVIDGATAEADDAAEADGADAVIQRRVAELTAFQNADYAAGYAAQVRAVAEAERAALGAPGELTSTYARNLYKLMAYKDEYEVARLSLDPALDASVAAQFGPDARYYYRLHPPVLRSLGMQKKVTLGPWFRPVFRALYASRGVRGTALDVFGRTEVRRTERALPREYRDAVTAALPRLSAQTLPALVALADLPDMVRGYEEVKLANVARFRTALAQAVRELG
jgi:indolepyruvate ferredoxin oxidoreductase